MSRTENSIRNIKFSLFLQITNVAISFFVRKVFVVVLSQDYLGINGSFSNIISILNLTELGIGSAITYSLYKPLADGDKEQISAIMALYGKVHRVIGVIVALLGCTIIPLLPVLVRGLPDIPHIYLIYLLFLLDSSLSYFVGYKQSLILADQRQYIITVYDFTFKIIRSIAQILLLWFTRNYFLYLGIEVGSKLLQNVLLAQLAEQCYPYIKGGRSQALNPTIKQKILQNTRALVMHKVGGVIVFGTDNLLMSSFVGVWAVGLYSNYQMIINALNAVYTRIFGSLTASVGNLGATDQPPEQELLVFRRVNFAGNWLYGFSAICLAVLFNPFIELWVGADYLFGQEIVCLFALNFYVTGMRQATLTFRDAYGLYWYDRYKPIAESIVNLTVSIILAIPFGVAGIFIGTFVSTMTTCFWLEPLMLFKYGLHAPVRSYFVDYLINTVVTLLTATGVWCICIFIPGAGILPFLEKMAVCVVIGNLGYLLAYFHRKEFHYYLDLAKSLILRVLPRHK